MHNSPLYTKQILHSRWVIVGFRYPTCDTEKPANKFCYKNRQATFVKTMTDNNVKTAGNDSLELPHSSLPSLIGQTVEVVWSDALVELHDL